MGGQSIGYGIDYMAEEPVGVSKKQKLFGIQTSRKKTLAIIEAGSAREYLTSGCLFSGLPKAHMLSRTRISANVLDGSLWRYSKAAYPMSRKEAFVRQPSSTSLLSPKNPEHV